MSKKSIFMMLAVFVAGIGGNGEWRIHTGIDR